MSCSASRAAATPMWFLDFLKVDWDEWNQLPVCVACVLQGLALKHPVLIKAYFEGGSSLSYAALVQAAVGQTLMYLHSLFSALVFSLLEFVLSSLLFVVSPCSISLSSFFHRPDS